MRKLEIFPSDREIFEFSYNLFRWNDEQESVSTFSATC